MSRNEILFNNLTRLECPDSTYRPAANPIVLARAKGSLIYDADGKEYIDLCAGFGVLSFGHNPDYVLDILSLDKDSVPAVMHGLGDVYPSVDKVEFLTELFSVLPSHLRKAALALTGAQAVELALKTAMMATGRSRFLTFSGGYHGLDLGVLPVTTRDDFRAPFDGYLRPDVSGTLPFGCPPEEIERIFENSRKQSVEFAAAIVEPVQGRAGIRIAGTEWFRSLREICTRFGVLLIFDEVFTGFGRTGRISFSEVVEADLVCFGKAVGGGFPVSVCVGTGPVMNAWPECSSEALHTGTFFGHPLSCRVGAQTIRAIKSANLAATAVETGAALLLLLKKQLSTDLNVKNIRGEGLMVGVEFHIDGFAARMMEELRSLGVIAIPSGERGHVLSITPALNIEFTLLERAVSLIKKALFQLR